MPRRVSLGNSTVSAVYSLRREDQMIILDGRSSLYCTMYPRIILHRNSRQPTKPYMTQKGLLPGCYGGVFFTSWSIYSTWREELLYNSVVYSQQSIRSGCRARIQLYPGPNKPKVKLKENRRNKHVLIELIGWS